MPITRLARAVLQTTFILLASGALAGSAGADTVLERDLFADQMGTRQSSFLALNLDTGQQCRLSGSDLQTRHAPWSTFKIPNLLIALETGAVDDIDDWSDWNPALRPAAGYWPDTWRRGQTLGSAFRHSAVWYFQDIALDVTAPQYRTILTEWGYGNAAVPDGSDNFWLGGPLALSVTEQVSFLERLVTGQLGVDNPDLADLARVADAGPLGDLTLYGKTGAGTVNRGQFNGPFEGWYVGWLTRDGDAAIVFAHQTQGESFKAIRTFRKDFAEVLLMACGLTE